MSVFTAIEQFFVALEILRKCGVSWVIKTLSEIAHPGTKAD